MNRYRVKKLRRSRADVVPNLEPVGLVSLGAHWYQLPDGRKVQGKKKALALL